jgi:hypothetical protein
MFARAGYLALGAQGELDVQAGLVVRDAYLRHGFSRSALALRAFDPKQQAGLRSALRASGV